MRNLFCFVAILAVAPVVRGEALNGRWDATVEIKGTKIPFRIDFANEGSNFTGTVFNGELPVTTTSGKLDGDHFAVSFGHYLTRLEAGLKDGELAGTLSGRFERDRYITSYPF